MKKWLMVLVVSIIMTGCYNQEKVLSTLTYASTETVEYYTLSEIDNNLKNKIESAANEVLTKFERSNQDIVKFKIVIADDGTIKKLGMGNSTGASYSGEVIGIDESRINEVKITNTLRHEMIHAMTWIEGNQIPGWFNEGIAQYFMFDINREKIDSRIIMNINEAYRNGSLINFEELNHNSGKWKKNRELAYDQSTSMYYYLINKYDEGIVNELYYLKGDFYINLKKVTGIEFNELVEQWQESIIQVRNKR